MLLNIVIEAEKHQVTCAIKRNNSIDKKCIVHLSLLHKEFEAINTYKYRYNNLFNSKSICDIMRLIINYLIYLPLYNKNKIIIKLWFPLAQCNIKL